MLSHFNHVWLFGTLWTVARQAPPLSVGFSRQEYRSGLPCPPPGDLSNPGIKPLFASCIGRQAPYHLRHPGSPWCQHAQLYRPFSCRLAGPGTQLCGFLVGTCQKLQPAFVFKFWENSSKNTFQEWKQNALFWQRLGRMHRSQLSPWQIFGKIL